jgi:hypothetical protein
MANSKAFLDINIGDAAAYSEALSKYQRGEKGLPENSEV